MELQGSQDPRPPRADQTGKEEAQSGPFNVKHLECYFYAAQGHCKWGRSCRYAHHTTGRIAAMPRPAGNGLSVAGRNALSSNPTFRRWQGVPIHENGLQAADIYEQGRQLGQGGLSSDDLSEARRGRLPIRGNYSSGRNPSFAGRRADTRSASPRSSRLPYTEIHRTGVSRSSPPKNSCQLHEQRDFVITQGNIFEEVGDGTSIIPTGDTPSMNQMQHESNVNVLYAEGTSQAGAQQSKRLSNERKMHTGSGSNMPGLAPAVVEEDYVKTCNPGSILPLNQSDTEMSGITSSIGDITIKLTVSEYQGLQMRLEQLQKTVSKQKELLAKGKVLLERGSHILGAEGRLAMDVSQDLQRGVSIDLDTATDIWLSANQMLDAARAFEAMSTEWCQALESREPRNQ